MNQEIRQETNKPENSKKPEKDTALRDHIKARITRKPNRIIKRSFIESAMCNHNIVMLLMGMLVFLGILQQQAQICQPEFAFCHRLHQIRISAFLVHQIDQPV